VGLRYCQARRAASTAGQTITSGFVSTAQSMFSTPLWTASTNHEHQKRMRPMPDHMDGREALRSVVHVDLSAGGIWSSLRSRTAVGLLSPSTRPFRAGAEGNQPCWGDDHLDTIWVTLGPLFKLF